MRSRDAFYLPPFLPASLPPSFASLPLGCVATFFHFILILSRSFSVLQDYSRSFRDSLWFWRALRIVWASRQTLQKDVCQDRSGSFRIVQDLWGCFEMPPTSVTWWSDPSPPTILSRGGLHFRLQELLSDSLGSINIAAAFFLLRGGSTFTIPRNSFKMLQHPSTPSTDPPRQHRKNPTPSTPTSKLHIVQHHGLLMTVQKVMHLWHKRREPTTTTPPTPLLLPPPMGREKDCNVFSTSCDIFLVLCLLPIDFRLHWCRMAALNQSELTRLTFQLSRVKRDVNESPSSFKVMRPVDDVIQRRHETTRPISNKERRGGRGFYKWKVTNHRQVEIQIANKRSVLLWR